MRVALKRDKNNLYEIIVDLINVAIKPARKIMTNYVLIISVSIVFNVKLSHRSHSPALTVPLNFLRSRFVLEHTKAAMRASIRVEYA